MKWMRHPTLPDNDPIEVFDSQVPHLASAGWQETDPPVPPVEDKDEADGGEPDGADQKKTPRRPSVRKSED